MKQRMKIFASFENSEIKTTLVNLNHAFMIGNEGICIGETEVHYSPPENLTEQEMLNHAIQTFRDRKKRILADAHLACSELDKKINQCQLLKFDDDSEADVTIIEKADSFDDDILF